MQSSRRRRLQLAADILVPVLVALIDVAGILDTRLDPPLPPLGVLAAVVQGTALWWRRSHPVRVLLVCLAAGTVIQLLAPVQLFPYAALFALGSVAAANPPAVSLPALAAVLGVTSIAYAGTAEGDVSFAMAVAVVPWALGEARRNRRQAVLEGARLAVSEEQGRIARELHDVLAHSITVIVVQAAAANDVFDEQPQQARTALRSIETSARQALGELRTVLSGVRPGEAPWLDRLNDLAEPLRAAGLTVGLRREGETVRLPGDLDLSAYRIVQEALTNTLRHAGATHAEVTVRTGNDLLEVDVVDDGSGSCASSDGAGRGLSGMRERAALLGGTLDAGPLPAGGFQVSARLPLRPRR